ncbi:MAG TPA: TIGR04255 family protein, partial [Pirellulales bacterium]|nr:TIGR04255 family protein [Pirellulales bacterium]
MSLQSSIQIQLDEPFPHLPNAPIVEAVIQWVARAGKTLAPDEIRQQLSERLPDYPDCQPQRALLLEAQFDVVGSSRHSQQDTWLGFRCTSGDKLHIFQFNRDGVVFSRLKPYETWEVFSREAMRVWRIFAAIAQPTEIERLGVRFINRIAPIAVSDLATYLKRPPRTLSRLGLPISSFLWQSRHDVPGHPFQVNVIQAIQPPAGLQSNEPGLILDIDVSCTQPLAPTDELV